MTGKRLNPWTTVKPGWLSLTSKADWRRYACCAAVLIPVLCCQTIGMTKTVHRPVIICSSNHSGEQSSYLAPVAVCALENTLSYFLCPLVFETVEINCTACWWAPEMPFLFSFKANRLLFSDSLLHCWNITVILTDLHAPILSSSSPKEDLKAVFFSILHYFNPHFLLVFILKNSAGNSSRQFFGFVYSSVLGGPWRSTYLSEYLLLFMLFA